MDVRRRNADDKSQWGLPSLEGKTTVYLFLILSLVFLSTR